MRQTQLRRWILSLFRHFWSLGFRTLPPNRQRGVKASDAETPEDVVLATGVQTAAARESKAVVCEKWVCVKQDFSPKALNLSFTLFVYPS